MIRATVSDSNFDCLQFCYCTYLCNQCRARKIALYCSALHCATANCTLTVRVILQYRPTFHLFKCMYVASSFLCGPMAQLAIFASVDFWMCLKLVRGVISHVFSSDTIHYAFDSSNVTMRHQLNRNKCPN